MPTFTLITAAAGRRALVRRPIPRQVWKRPSSTTTPPPKPSSSNAKSNSSAATNGASIPIPATVATLPLWQRLGPLSRGLEAYARSQRKRPYMTQFFSALGIYFLGDMSAQNLSGEAYDPLRTVRALIIGAGSSIPSYKWYEFCFCLSSIGFRNISLEIWC